MYRAQEYRAGACVRVSPWHLDRVARLWEIALSHKTIIVAIFQRTLQPTGYNPPLISQTEVSPPCQESFCRLVAFMVFSFNITTIFM